MGMGDGEEWAIRLWKKRNANKRQVIKADRCGIVDGAQ